jgi:hypothetical protein
MAYPNKTTGSGFRAQASVAERCHVLPPDQGAQACRAMAIFCWMGPPANVDRLEARDWHRRALPQTKAKRVLRRQLFLFVMSLMKSAISNLNSSIEGMSISSAT